MKRLGSLLLALLIVGLSLGGAMGCATGATPARKGYTTISDVTAAATAVMKAFNERYQAGLQTEADRTKVLAGWAEFQSLMHAAEAVAKDPNRTADPLALANDAIANLVFLINSLKTNAEMPPPTLWWLSLPEGAFA